MEFFGPVIGAFIGVILFHLLKWERLRASSREKAALAEEMERRQRSIAAMCEDYNTKTPPQPPAKIARTEEVEEIAPWTSRSVQPKKIPHQPPRLKL